MSREIKLGAVGIQRETTKGTVVRPELYVPLFDKQQPRRVWFRHQLERFCRWLMNMLDIEEAE